jgi:hypothetical protein
MTTVEDGVNLIWPYFRESVILSPMLLGSWIAFSTLPAGWALFVGLIGGAVLSTAIVGPLVRRTVRRDIERFRLGQQIAPTLQPRVAAFESIAHWTLPVSIAAAGLPVLFVVWFIQGLLGGIALGVVATDLVSTILRYRLAILHWRAYGKLRA